MKHPFISALKETNHEKKLFEVSDSLLIAVSGGMDSMCLLDALCKIHTGRIEVAHLNYKLRGQDSEQDHYLVRDYCMKNEITFHYKESDLSNEETGIQEKARRIRYDWFYALLAEGSFTYLVTAHHFDDQMETVLLRLIRGTGLKGMSGMPDKTEKIVRPMLHIPRELIEQYQKDNNVQYRQDISNFTNYYTRNFIRNEILNSLKKYYENLPFGFKTSISNFKKDWNLLQSLLKNWAAENINMLDGHYHIPLTQLEGMDEKETFLFHLLEGRLEMEFIYQLLNTGQSGLRFDKGEFSILLDRDSIIIRPYATKDIEMEIPNPGTYELPGGKISIVKSKAATISEDPTEEMVVLSQDDFPLRVRYWKEGDSFQPLGMNGNSKKLSNFFIDSKIDSFRKEETPILVNSGGKIIWVMGKRLDERFKISDTEKSGKRYRLSFTKLTHQTASQIFKYLP